MGGEVRAGFELARDPGAAEVALAELGRAFRVTGAIHPCPRMPSKMIHEAWLPAGTIVFITVDAAWDLNWVEGPPTAADLIK